MVTKDLEKLGFSCYECNCRMTLEEFTSREHAEEHIGKWCNNDIMKRDEIIKERKEFPLQMNTLENIKKDPSRKRGNKVY